MGCPAIWKALRMWPRLLVRVVQALVGAAAAVAILLEQQDLPSAAYWKDHRGYFYAALVAFVVAAFALPLVDATAEHLRERGPTVGLAVMELLLADFYNIMVATGLGCTEIGLHAFVVRRPVRRLFWPEQQRVGTLRLGPVPGPSRIRWTRGKGLIGKCWAERSDQGADLVSDFGPRINDTREQWEALPEETRYGLSFEEFTRTKGSYGAIVASPMVTKRGRYKGCIAVDAPGSAYALLWGQGVRGILQASAQAMLVLLKDVS